MKAVLLLNGHGLPMAQVQDRPFIQHVIEQLVERGVREISLLYGQPHEAAARYLGDGTRWGIRVEAIPVLGQGAAADLERACASCPSGLVLLGNAGRLAHLPTAPGQAGPWSTLYFDEEDGVGGWSGWALLEAQVLPGFGAATASGSGWREAARASGVSARKVFLEFPTLSCASPKEILAANRRALTGEFPGLFCNGREREAGIRVARGARIPASATLRSPCYIGEDAWIGDKCTIGPYAVIAAGAVIEQRSRVAGSVIGPKTFLGPELEITDSLVERNHVHNVRLDVDFVVEESHIVSAI